MTVVEMPHAVAPGAMQAAGALDGTVMRWWDAEAECTVTIARPADNTALWEDYLHGAQRSYRRHGIDAAIDIAEIRRSQDTSLFWAMLDGTGAVVGGIRAIGPLTSPDQSHAVVEWADHPSQGAVRKMISDRIPFGVVEMKSAWVTDDPGRNRGLTAALARVGCQALAVLGVQFAMATGAQHVLARWRSSGGVVAPIRSTCYPDERFRTKLMWWDRRTVASLAAPSQTAKIVTEMAAIRNRLNIASRYAPVGG